MGDKNNKSFSDLFSSISSEDESSQEKKITFDSLLSGVDSGEKSNVSSSDIFSDGANTNHKELQLREENNTYDGVKDKNIDKEEENNNSVDSFRFGDIFNLKDSDNHEIEEADYSNEEFKKVEGNHIDSSLEQQNSLLRDGKNPVEKDNISNSSNNPFFEEEQTFESDKDSSSSENSTLEEGKSVEGINLFESHQESNPFFTENASKIEDEEIRVNDELENIKNTDVDSSAGRKNITEEKDFLVNKESSSNPFFGEVSHSEEENAPVIDFSSQDNSLNSNVDLGNVFFQQNEDSEMSNSSLNIKNTEEEKSDFLEKNLPKKTENQEEKKPEVVSPFFMDNTNSENPYSALEKINLIENENKNKVAKKIDLSSVKHYDVKIEKKKEPLLKFILGVISYAIFIWLLLVGVALLVYVLDIKIRAAKGDYSSPTFNAYVVLTGSMLPEIQVYDVVVTKKVDPSSLEVGDVITFASADSRFLNTIITHRIIKKEYDTKTKSYSFQTQGDNNNVADSALVPQNNIFGKVILKIPKLGYLQEFLASDGGWIIVILIPCLTVVSYDVVKLVKGLKKKKYKGITVQK
ncbi:MAG: signal peptidase I [Bacilli bacterium]|nr:signal peptidase I [Bacilli bacterium]